MRGVIVVLLLIRLSALAAAQAQPAPAAERDAVLKAVQAVFDTMAAKDVEARVAS